MAGLSLYRRSCVFFLWCAATVGLFWGTFENVVRHSLEVGYASHIIVMPFVATWLIWTGRTKVFDKLSNGWAPAVCLLGFAGSLLLLVSLVRSGLTYDVISLITFAAALVFVLAGFVACYGRNALLHAAFPFFVLFLALPIPSGFMDQVISALQSGSTDLTHWMFIALGVPVVREGFTLSVPGATIEVAKECSGINSTVALLIVTLLLAHETLQSNWHRLSLLMIAIPLSIVKNGIRITTLTMLALRVDPSFLTGRLHHQGGFVFFLIALGIMYPVWSAMRTAELARAWVPRHRSTKGMFDHSLAQSASVGEESNVDA